MKKKVININDHSRIKIYSKPNTKTKVRKWKRMNKEKFNHDETLWDWESEPIGLNYQVLSRLLDLEENDYYIQIDDRPTYWYCKKDCDGFMKHKKLSAVKLVGRNLIVHFDGKIQKYRYQTKYEFYEKIEMNGPWYNKIITIFNDVLYYCIELAKARFGKKSTDSLNG